MLFKNINNKALNNNNDNLRDIKGKSKTGLSQYQPAQLRGAPKVLKTPFMKLRPSEKSYHENSLNFIKSLNTIHQQNIYENANVTKDLLKNNYRRCKNVNHKFEHINSNPRLNNSLHETQHRFNGVVHTVSENQRRPMTSYLGYKRQNMIGKNNWCFT